MSIHLQQDHATFRSCGLSRAGGAGGGLGA